MEENPRSDEWYGRLPATGPNTTALGTAFITLVEPHLGSERAYNRWYEDDHFYSGAMSFPWWFSGRRWVATRDLRELRHPIDSPVANPIQLGCYLGTYWITEGRHDEQLRWLHGTVTRLAAEGRMFADRVHVHTSYYERVATRRLHSTGPTEVHALDYPYSGVVFETIDARDGVSRQQLISDLVDGEPAGLASGVVDLCVLFVPKAWPATVEQWFDHAPTPENRVALLWFTLQDPRECWETNFNRISRPLTDMGISTFVAGFIPTIPGTDAYVDDLR